MSVWPMGVGLGGLLFVSVSGSLLLLVPDIPPVK